MNTKQFIEKAREVHGDKYDYSKVEYKNSHTKVCIICPIHGEFWQMAYSHLQGIGCKKCGTEQCKCENKLTREEFIKRAREVHGDKYDYSKVEYVNNKTKVCIICHEIDPLTGKEHGEFWQTPSSHLSGSGCRQCTNIKLSKERMWTTKEWIEKAKKIHHDKYDYSKTIYKGYYNKVTIICPEHGEFKQIAYDHLQGKGCPKCKFSKMEIEWFYFLKEKGVNFIHQYRPTFLKNGRSQLSLDFFFPDNNSALECQGTEHFEGGTFYSREKTHIFDRDKRKNNLCKKENVHLYYYSNIVKNDYMDKVYNDKDELLNIILANGK